jgi:hypothetical protein
MEKLKKEVDNAWTWLWLLNNQGDGQFRSPGFFHFFQKWGNLTSKPFNKGLM